MDTTPDLCQSHNFQMPVRHKTLFVRPEIPTTLDGQEILELVDGNDLVLQHTITSLYVVAGALDPVRFCAALSRTLQSFPTVAGRLKRNGDEWQIDLCNGPVPVHVASSPSYHVLPHPPSTAGLALYEDPPAAAHVVQPFTHIAPYVDEVDVVAAMNGQPEAYLCSFVLTLMGDGRTAIGISLDHVLGDETTVGLFMRTLSASYIDIEAALDGPRAVSSQTTPVPGSKVSNSPPMPLFQSRSFPRFPPDPLSLEHEALVRGTAPHLLCCHPFDKFIQAIREECDETEAVTLHFEQRTVEALWERARAAVHHGAGELGQEKVTRHDALIAYLVTLQNDCSGEPPIHTIQHVMNVRLRQPPAGSSPHLLHRHPHVVGNRLQTPNIPLHCKRGNDALVGAERGAWFSESLYEIAEGAPAWPAWADEPQRAASSFPESEDIQRHGPQQSEVQDLSLEMPLEEGASPIAPYTSLGLIARAFRRGNRLSRLDKWTERYLRLSSARYKEGARRGRFSKYPAPGVVAVNSLMGVDIKDKAHFGFGPVQYYSNWSALRIFRVHNANPTVSASPGASKEQKWQDPESAVVVCFRVKIGTRKMVEDTKARDEEELKAGLA
ncbi:hypothetical protein FA95DRAFT_1609436 [Auriscalpium vulgare]|uniref:Uncharacterized protein n=1 Tax=Auriscalpium vulgare TaxID=40419 RepID=A0ACB8RGP9_9AGAM|nr:hypothetical protein FA95DRAFT_1609436 [Auriscalpium vulgare]